MEEDSALTSFPVDILFDAKTDSNLVKVCCKYVSMDGIHMAPAPASAVLWVRDNELSDKPTLDAWKDDLYVLAKVRHIC